MFKYYLKYFTRFILSVIYLWMFKNFTQLVIVHLWPCIKLNITKDTHTIDSFKEQVIFSFGCIKRTFSFLFPLNLIREFGKTLKCKLKILISLENLPSLCTQDAKWMYMRRSGRLLNISCKVTVCSVSRCLSFCYQILGCSHWYQFPCTPYPYTTLIQRI